MRKMFPLIVLLLHLSAVYCDSHTLRYYTTGVSAPGSGLPEFSSVGYVDDREIVNYNSDSGRTRPKVQWMEEQEEPGYWEGQTQVSKGNEAVFRQNVRTVMSRFNQTGGFHSFQAMRGCELSDDGTIRGYEQYGYDGEEFISLDTQTWTYIPTMSQAQITAQRWNSPEEQVGERHKNYLENECIEWLKKYVEKGREDLERREPTKPSSWVIPVVIAVVVITLLGVGIGGFLLYKKKNPDYKPTSTSETSSDQSNNAAKA